MYSVLGILIGLAIGASPLGNIRFLRLFVMAVTGG